MIVVCESRDFKVCAPCVERVMWIRYRRSVLEIQFRLSVRHSRKSFAEPEGETRESATVADPPDSPRAEHLVVFQKMCYRWRS